VIDIQTNNQGWFNLSNGAPVKTVLLRRLLLVPFVLVGAMFLVFILVAISGMPFLGTLWPLLGMCLLFWIQPYFYCPYCNGTLRGTGSGLPKQMIPTTCPDCGENLNSPFDVSKAKPPSPYATPHH
jgi:hypothetical protein